MADLLDELMPAWDERERHQRRIDAPPERVYEAVRAVTDAEMPLTRVLLAIRALRKPQRRGDRPLLDEFAALGFVLLGERPGSELAMGAIGRFWSLRGNAPIPIRSREEFDGFDEPGYAIAVMAFEVVPENGGSRLVTETRIRSTDAASRRRFRLYWRIIRLGSGAIRRSLLRAVKRRAESAGAASAVAP